MGRAKSGFSPLVIVLLIAAVLGAGFFILKTKTGLVSLPGLNQINSLQLVSEKDFANIADPTLRKHFTAQTNVATYRTRITSSGKGEIIDIHEQQLTRDDFFLRQIQEKQGKEVAHMISINDSTYVKDYSDSKWWKETLMPTEVKAEDKPAKPEDVKNEFLKEDPSLYKSLGTEPCEGLTCYKYEQTLKDMEGAKRTFWFDTKKYLLRKEVSGFGEFTTEITYSYDGINIKTPSPTKDVPAGKSVYDYFYPVEIQKNYTPPENFPANSNFPAIQPLPSNSYIPPTDTSEDNNSGE